jgi:hypothetical protein
VTEKTQGIETESMDWQEVYTRQHEYVTEQDRSMNSYGHTLTVTVR